MALTAANIKYEAAQEAVSHLGYLKPDAVQTIVSMMTGGMIEHPRSITPAYRKDGEQLSREEKKALGIRANGFMSRRAFDDLSEIVKSLPLTAHEATLLRAVFTENRFNRIMALDLTDELRPLFDGFRYDAATLDCPFCRRVDGTVVTPESAAILPSPECVCETANYAISPKFDFLKGVV